MPGFDDKILALDIPGLPQSSETTLRTAPWVQHTYPVDLPRLRSGLLECVVRRLAAPSIRLMSSADLGHVGPI